MRNYIDPEINIAMFESENVVAENASNLAKAQSFFETEVAGANGTTTVTGIVAAAYILDFTE